MKQFFCTVFGLIGSAIATAFGGWDDGLITLCIFMGLDLISGLVVAGVFRKSKKTESGTLSSKSFTKGLFKKCMVLAFVLVAYRLDLLVGTNYIRNAVIIAFCASEVLSLIENAGLMGVPIPSVITKSIDMLRERAGETAEQKETAEGAEQNAED